MQRNFPTIPLPLAARKSLTKLDGILTNPNETPPRLPNQVQCHIQDCAGRIREAKINNAAVILIFGAHLIKNGAAPIITELLNKRLITHMATNGAASIHDFEFAFQGTSTEDVRENIANGTFGIWDETGRYISLAVTAGAVNGIGYGKALGAFIQEDGIELPGIETLERSLRHGLDSAENLPAQAQLLKLMKLHRLNGGRIHVPHAWKKNSVFAQACANSTPITVHPGIGYDIIVNHPYYSGAAFGHAAELDYLSLAHAVDNLDNGVVISIGTAVMGPQVLEKSISRINHSRITNGRPVVKGHSIFAVDIQDADGWDWSHGEPPKSHPAYYIRFCKSYSRMGGGMSYICCDNVKFIHNLYHMLESDG